MNENVFIEKMMEILDLETKPSLEDTLESFEEWDSLGMLTFMSMATKVVGHKISPEVVQEAETFTDLFAIVAREAD